MNFCQKCVYPITAVNLDIDDENICSSCRFTEQLNEISDQEWKIRERKLVSLIEKNIKKNKPDYDCIVPVGGGKDSYFQVHKLIELGFKPLLVTYYGNNFLPEGQTNLDSMKDNFGCDHVIFYPNVELLKKINLAAFKMMGDMNWHNHAGINIIPSQYAIKFNTNLFIWGEIAWDVSGMFSPDHYMEFNKRMVLEHDMRGYTREDFYGKEGIEKNDLKWCKLPEDKDYKKYKLCGLYLGNFLKWDPYVQTDIIKKKYGWTESKEKFERTYRKISNLDDMHENGIHDYLKWVKFGYGRCSDHASKDIRLGYMDRSEGMKLVMKYDHVKPKKDLRRWLKYVNISEDEFDYISDTFRDKKSWTIQNGKWFKVDLDGKIRDYGESALKKEEQEKYKKSL